MAPGCLRNLGAVVRLFSSRFFFGSRPVTSPMLAPETLLTPARALPYARSGDTLAWVEAPLVAVAVRSVPAHPNRDDWTDATGKLIASVEGGSMGDCVPFAAGSTLVR